MSSECVTLMEETILSSSSLERIELWQVHSTAENASKFKLLENNSNLASLKFINCVGLNLVVPYVTEALYKNTSLKVLGIPDSTAEVVLPVEVEYVKNDIDMKALSRMLVVNSTLTELEIYQSKLTRDDVYILNNALQRNKTLKHLFLHPNAIKFLDPRIQPSRPSIHRHIEKYEEL